MVLSGWNQSVFVDAVQVSIPAAANAFLDHFGPGSIRLVDGFELEWMPLAWMLGPIRIDVESRSD